MRPDEQAIRIAFVLRDVLLDPVNGQRNIATAIVPVSRSGMSLYEHAHHSILRGPPSDVVVKGVGLACLLFDLVAGAARDVDQHWTIAATFVRCEDVDDVLGIRTEGLI